MTPVSGTPASKSSSAAATYWLLTGMSKDQALSHPVRPLQTASTGDADIMAELSFGFSIAMMCRACRSLERFDDR